MTTRRARVGRQPRLPRPQPSPGAAEDLDHPDELRVDLDPVPGVPGAGPRGGARGPRVARRARPHRLAQDLGLARDPHQRADRAALDVPAGPARGAGAGAGRGAPGAGDRDLEMVEGGAPRRVPRLQPERQGPHRGLRLLRAAHARRAGVLPAPLGRGADVRHGGLHAGHGARALRGARRRRGRDRRRRGLAGRAAGAVGRATRPRARATRRGRPTTRNRRASRLASSRRASAGPTRSTPAAARTAGRRRKSRRTGSRRGAGDPNAGLPTEWQGSRPSPTGRRRSSVPVIELGRAPTKAEVYAGLERWKARHPRPPRTWNPRTHRDRDAWPRVRVVPAATQPDPCPGGDPATAGAPGPRRRTGRLGSLSDDERAAWMAGRRPSRKTPDSEG